MDKKTTETFVGMIRQLVSDVQGAPFPGPSFELEVYNIWYEHVQRNAQRCFEFLDEHFPLEQKEIDETFKKMFK